MANERGRETQAVRLSFRATPKNAAKLSDIATTKRWLNAHGGPNLSRVLNHIIDKHRDEENSGDGREEE